MRTIAVFAALTVALVAASGCDRAKQSGAAVPTKHESETAQAVKTERAPTTTASGLRYEVLEGGSGDSPAPSDSVTIKFRSFLPDGTEFDSTDKRGTTVNFPVYRSMRGWTEGLLLMKEGAKYRFTIPSELAYGATGSPDMVPAVPPNTTIVCEIELLKIYREPNTLVDVPPAAG